MIRRWLITLGKLALGIFIAWHVTTVTVSALPDRSTFSWVQTIKGEVLPYTDPYAYWFGQWQNWGMFSESSVSRIFKHSFQAWDNPTQQWVTVEKLGFHDLPLLTKGHETALLRSLEDDTNWLSRERYLQLKCIDLKMAPGTWVRMGYEYFDMPLDDSGAFTPNTWEQWEPQWIPWDDPHWTKCPDPSTPRDTWPVPQDGTAT